MAGKRLARSAVDWSKFAEMVPKDEATNFAHFRAKSTGYASRVSGLPESLPVIDFASYRARAVGPAVAVVEAFEKQYKALNIAFPKDTQNLTSKIDESLKEEEDRLQKWVAGSKQRVEQNKKELEKWDKIPMFEHMVLDEFAYYFPQYALFHPDQKPSIAPHTPEENADWKVRCNSDYRRMRHLGGDAH